MIGSLWFEVTKGGDHPTLVIKDEDAPPLDVPKTIP